MKSPSAISFRKTKVGRAMQSIEMENDLISITVNLDQGADVLSLLYKPAGIDALFHIPWKPREPGVGSIQAVDPFTEWCLYYRGGWNLLFPNLGGQVTYKGSNIDRHGEAARAAWVLTDRQSDEKRLAVTLEASLLSLPFNLKRVFSLELGQPILTLHETVTNCGPEAVDCEWFNQLMFGGPLLSRQSFVDCGARTVWMDEGMAAAFDVPGVDLPTSMKWKWPQAQDKDGKVIDLSLGPQPGITRLLILDNFDSYWCSLCNPQLNLGVGVVWDGSVLPFAYIYEETGGWKNFPYFGRVNMLGFAPASSYPIMGLEEVRRRSGTQLTFLPDESRTLEMKIVFFEAAQHLKEMDREGRVLLHGNYVS